MTNGRINRIDYWICGGEQFCAGDNASMAHKNLVRQQVGYTVRGNNSPKYSELRGGPYECNTEIAGKYEASFLELRYWRHCYNVPGLQFFWLDA